MGTVFLRRQEHRVLVSHATHAGFNMLIKTVIRDLMLRKTGTPHWQEQNTEVISRQKSKSFHKTSY